VISFQKAQLVDLQTMARVPQRTVSIPSQPARSCIILHPLGFVFYAQAVFGLAITENLIEI
jgi:hypothetical protein